MNIDPVDNLRRSQPEVHTQIALWHEARSGLNLLHLLAAACRDGHDRRNRAAIRSHTHQLERKEWQTGPSIVPQQARRLIHVIDEQIQVTVIVEIADCQAAARVRRGYPRSGDSAYVVHLFPAAIVIQKPRLAVRRAGHPLFQLGIDRSLLLDRVRNGYDETSTKIDREGNQLSSPKVVLRGISFERRIDGIPLSDAWCFLIHFGSHGRIEDFKLRWRSLLPYKSHRLLTPAQIVEMIKSGKAVLPPQMSDTTGLDSAKKLTVVKITPRYYSGTNKEVLDFMCPYADLEMTAEMENTNTTTFFLSCPILSTNSLN